MEEQRVRERKRQRGRLPGWAKILLTVFITLAVSTGLWCLALGSSGLALVETYLLGRFAFVDAQADLDGAVDQALAAFVDGLGDRWSYYLDAESYKATNERRANNYVGVGVTVNYTREEGLLVQSVTEGGPAEQAGIVAGDIITAVDGVSIAGEKRTQGTDLILGEAGTQVTLTLLGEDGASREAVCTRATLRNPSAHGKMLEGNIGYVKLDNFYSGAADSFVREVDALVEQGRRPSSWTCAATRGDT